MSPADDPTDETRPRDRPPALLPPAPLHRPSTSSLLDRRRASTRVVGPGDGAGTATGTGTEPATGTGTEPATGTGTENRSRDRDALRRPRLLTDGGRPDDGSGGGGGDGGDDEVADESGGPDDAHVAAVRESLTEATRVSFDRRARAEAARIADDCEAGRLDNADVAVGLELEAPVVDASGRPVRVPSAVLESPGFSPELAVHDVEVHTDPDVVGDGGLLRQRAVVRERLATLRSMLGPDRDVVLDGMWAVPPAEGSRSYFEGYDVREGFRFARRMTPNARYYAIDNEVLRRVGGTIPVDLPGVDAVSSILFEATATSIQPHIQLPAADALPTHLRVATRTLAPVLALTVNSPFLPADYYADSGPDSDPDDPQSGAGDDGEPLADVDTREEVDPEAVLDGPAELRVPVFERTVNAGLPAGDRKCRVPADVDTAREAFERIAGDVATAPMPVAADAETGGDGGGHDDDGDDRPYGDRFPAFRAKRGTFWRWVRPVVGGDIAADAAGPAAGNDDASVRIEYRPVPTQPTVDDVVAVQALVTGAVRGLVEADHPVAGMDWATARRSFYRVVDDGLDADLAWVTADGEPTDDRSRCFEELFAYARRGLASSGVDPAVADELLAPVEARWEARATPAAWKRRRTRERLDSGASLPRAVVDTAREYARLAREHDRFVDWL